MQKYNKAIAALVTTGVTFAAAIWGFDVSPELAAGITTLLTTIVTFLVPNKEA
jgi:uncharacterized protein (DUF697 family)